MNDGEPSFPVIIPEWVVDRQAALAIARQRDRWREAFEARDVDAIMRFYLRDIYSYDLMPAEEDGRRLLAFDGEAAWRRNWVTFFDAFAPGLTVSIDSLTVYPGGDLATMRGLTRLVGLMNGVAIDTWVRETNVVRLVDGEWLIVHDHVSVPIDFASGTALLDLRPA